MILVEFSNLTFGLEPDIEQVPNVKFTPLGYKALLQHFRDKAAVEAPWRCFRDVDTVDKDMLANINVAKCL